MRHLYLLRHAKSSWSHPKLDDHDRPLTPRGERGAKAVRDFLREHDVAPALVLCSSARRTRDTLELVTPALDKDAEVQVERRMYGASSDQLLEMLHDVQERLSSVMLVGHNPGMHDLAVLLAARGEALGRLRAKFPTCALAVLTLADGPWRRLAPGDGELVAFFTPKDTD